MNYYYKILFFSFIVPFLFSFHPKVLFYKKFNIIIKSIPIAAFPFIIWDIIFVRYDIWGFNKKYIINRYIFNLPIEEVLFFFVIPFCCLYSYHLIDKYKISFFNNNFNWKLINNIFMFFLIVLAVLNFNKLYTFFCFLCFILIILLERIIRVEINYNLFYTFFILIIIPMIIVNGALTGLFYNQVVVWYNESEILGIRFFSMPIEDLIYCHQLTLFNIMIYKKIQKNN
ncbi:MAG: hypothetical protein CMG64_04140 [Candidatus Marinimicrobia bacterium]|nr:hypothetical protein [Candidatus Neomarinimicrobiota bacterium]|tara:strand:- start:4928 stop:5611 length:684 start_codon:yes stop_codon:yes gene_type:complete